MKKIITKIVCLLVCVTTLLAAVPSVAIAAEVRAFAEAVAEELNDPGYLSLDDGYMRVQVSKKNGGFFIGTNEGDKLNKSDNNKQFLYPDDDFDTSFTTFRVTQGGKTRDYIFGRDYGFLGLDTSDVSVYKSADNAISADWSVGGLMFTQTIATVDTNSNLHGMVYITYSMKNLSESVVEKIEARVMMDTSLGYQDYAVYMTAGNDGVYRSVTRETTISGDSYNNYFYSYDNATSPSISAYTINATVGGEVVVPDRVTFAHWNNLAASAFDYTPPANGGVNFTSSANLEYMTADSAFAMYYSMGAPKAGENAKPIGFYYGVYSNAKVGESDLALNFINADILELNEEKSAYLDANGELPGNYSLDIKLQNVADYEMKKLAIAIMPGEFMYPMQGDTPVMDKTHDDPFYVTVEGLKAGAMLDTRLDFLIDVSQITDYRRIKLTVYDISGTEEFTENNTVLSTETYVYCEGSVSAELGFTGMTPQAVGESGRRFLYLTGTNFRLLRDKTQYRIVLRPLAGDEDTVISTDRLVVNPDLNTATIVVDNTLSVGDYQIIIDWNDTAIPDIANDVMRISVLSPKDLDKLAVRSGIYSEVGIKRSGSGTSQDPFHYEIISPEGQGTIDQDKDVLLVLRGNFNVIESPERGIFKAEAITLDEGDVITINGSIDVKAGRVTVSVEYDDEGNQTAINVDIDGKVYTTGANTKVWDGVCAITSLEEGEYYALPYYSQDGVRGYLNPRDADAEFITLLWPGAASAAQTLVGMLFEMRYCEFAVMETKVHSYGRRVVSFSAQLCPSFLIPGGAELERAQSPMEEEQQRIVYANYTASDLRRVDNRYEQSQSEWRAKQQGTLNIYVDDILFGGYFIGFNTSVEIGIPAFVDGMPYIEGSLALKVINDEWELGLEGSASLLLFEMEAKLTLKSYNGIPILDDLYFFIGGFQPGVPVDPFGVFWIRGAGGGVENLYELFFVSDRLPAVALMLTGEFAIFSILSARADLKLSLHGIEAALSNVEIAGITLIDYVGGSIYWYPNFSIALGLHINILDCIIGYGSIIARDEGDRFFVQGIVGAKVKIPDKIFLIGGLTIGSAELGINNDKIWGHVKVIGIGVGVTYYWGGKVKVDVLSEGNAEEGVPVYEDEDGDVLYVKTTNGIRVLASSESKNGGVSSLSGSSGGVTSSTDKRTHSFVLNTAAVENGLITVTYPAQTRAEAELLKSDLKVYADGSEYPISWMNTGLPADDESNLNANALLSYDDSTCEATVSISFTDASYTGKAIEINTASASAVTVYGIERYSDLDEAVFDEAAGTVTVSGSGLAAFSDITVYAVDGEDNIYPLGTADMSTVSGDSVTVPVSCPGNLPTGEYTVRAVANLYSHDGEPLATPTEDAEDKLVFVNTEAPDAVRGATVALGGNYMLNVDVIANGTDFDGYLVDIYESTEEGLKVTPQNNVRIALEEGETVTAGEPHRLTVGGMIQSGTDEAGEPVYYGLEAGKTYVVQVSTYKDMADGTIYETKPVQTAKIEMVAPVKTEPTLSIEGAVSVPVGTAGVSVDTVNTRDLTVKVGGVEGKVSGSYSINDGAPVAWDGGDIALSDLEDGIYTLTLMGVNETGDPFSELYQFSVDTAAPTVLISSPAGGGFFDSPSVTVTGISEAGSVVTATAGGEVVSTNVGSDGNFSLTLPLDVTEAYQSIKIHSTDKVGNVSEAYGFTLTNLVVGDPNAELVVLVDGKEADYISLGEGERKLSLAFRSGNNYVNITEGSIAAAKVNWRATVVQSSAELSKDGILKGETGAVGIVVATLDNLSASVRIIPTSIADMDISLEIPEGGYVYDGTEKRPEIKLPEGHGLTEGVDYIISYSNNVSAGEAKVFVSAVDGGKCSGSRVLTFRIESAPIDTAAVTLSEKSTAPTPTVKLGEKVLVKDTDYTVSYTYDEKSGDGSVTVTGIGNYKGSVSVAFSYKPFNHLVWIIPTASAVLIGGGVALFLIMKKRKTKSV